jgi:hypothetical protein
VSAVLGYSVQTELRTFFRLCQNAERGVQEGESPAYWIECMEAFRDMTESPAVRRGAVRRIACLTKRIPAVEGAAPCAS